MNSTPRRIAFCITDLDPGGAERALAQIATRLDRRRWNARVYCLSPPGELVAQLEAGEIPVHCFEVESRWNWGVVRRLRRELLSFVPDLLQTFLFHANMVGRLSAWRTPIPVVVSGLRVVEPDAPWRMRVSAWTNRLVTHNVCVSRAVAQRYESMGIGGESLTVIPNGVDVEALAAVPPADLAVVGIPPHARTLLAVGRLHPQKGFDQLIQAIGPVFERHADWHLLIVGEGPMRGPLEQQISRSEHPSRIHLVGRRSDVPALMTACDAFVLSSRWEGMPNALLEAMAAGLPVIATRVEGVDELIMDGRTGVLVEPNATALSTGIAALLASRQLSNLGQAGQERVRQSFRWEAVVREYDRLYTRLLNEAQSGQ